MRQVSVKHIDSRRRKVLEKVKYNYTASSLPGRPLSVMKGFTSDGASIPRALWTIVGCPDTFLYEALIHDWLYMTHECSREDADALFYALLVDGGVPRWKARVMHNALRAFGKGAWGYDAE